ncbi:MAG: aminodeoxychorismate synthase component I [Acidobacteriota bacterium]|jgi:para-aminobenzoate synthetase/4-amino-4-deoxychorismate lyase
MNRWYLVPADIYTLVEQTPATVLLESAKGGADAEREPYTRLFLAPRRICAAHELAELPGLFEEIERAVGEGLTVAGFFRYECGQCFEPAAGLRPGLAGQPLAWFGIYDRVFLFDHRTGQFTGGEPPGLDALRRGADAAAGQAIEAEFALTEEEYAARIVTIQEWIRAGDVYQLNFTAPIRVHTTADTAILYARLRARQPADFGAFLHWAAGGHILSFSPELFFRVDEAGERRRIITRPMKGTARRGRTTLEDRQQAEWLRNDPKNRAENVMIVDLLRNDLGRLAEFGSVRVEDLFAVERHPTLWQMTSTVTADLRGGIRFQDIFRALFPCGSVTGAPKVRAMQLLAQIEDEPRGVYTGAIGYFSPQQTVFNVAIRTLELEGSRGRMGVGSGIVIDSDPAAEFRECQLKAEFLTCSSGWLPERFSLVETLLWKDEYPLIELHLDRLEDSAQYFGFPCERSEVKEVLEKHARAFAGHGSRKVRLLLDSDGGLHITCEVLAETRGRTESGWVRISRRRTDPWNPMLFHKTTHRPLYSDAFRAATLAGFDDVLFLNRNEEVTEGAISNIFVEKEGRLYTPPVECGLLAGVYRRHVLETYPNAGERVLHIDDLRQADAVYLSNAVRGLRRVIIDWEG